MQVNQLGADTRNVFVEVEIIEEKGVRTGTSKKNNQPYRVAEFLVKDIHGSGTIQLTLWNDHIDEVQVGNKLKIDNGYMTSYKGQHSLNIGRFGIFEVMGDSGAAVLRPNPPR